MKKLVFFVLSIVLVISISGCTEDTAASSQKTASVKNVSSAESVNVSNSKDYVGFWRDKNTTRATMKIASDDGTNYKIDINWSDSATENTHWIFTGTYNKEKAEIVYTGRKVSETYDKSESKTENVISTNEKGVISSKSGKLYWNDEKENAGADLSFSRDT